MFLCSKAYYARRFPLGVIKDSFIPLSTHTAPCGGTFSSDQGEITSPNWPSDYHAQSVCTWRITIPSAKSIHIGFTHFEVQAVNVLGRCVDYVEIFNGETMASHGWLLYYKFSCSILYSIIYLFSVEASVIHSNVSAVGVYTLQNDNKALLSYLLCRSILWLCTTSSCDHLWHQSHHPLP